MTKHREKVDAYKAGFLREMEKLGYSKADIPSLMEKDAFLGAVAKGLGSVGGGILGGLGAGAAAGLRAAPGAIELMKWGPLFALGAGGVVGGTGALVQSLFEGQAISRKREERKLDKLLGAAHKAQRLRAKRQKERARQALGDREDLGL